MQEIIHRFKVGDFECIALLDYHETYKATDNFITVPEDELRQRYEELGIDFEANPFCYNCLAVNNGEQWILLDAGNGNLYPDRDCMLMKGLESVGLKPDDFKTIILTHLNGDHYGWLTDEDGNVTFPNAKVYIWEDEWRNWDSREETVAAIAARNNILVEEAQEYLQQNLWPIEPQLELIKQDGEILPGIDVIHTPGHTVGHMVVTIESAGERLMFIGDSFVVLPQITNPEWIPMWDQHDTALAIETRKRLAKIAVDENYLVHGYHFPFPGLVRIHADGDGWRWENVK